MKIQHIRYNNLLTFISFSALEEGVVTYDATSDWEVFVQCPILLVACDNPRAFVHHMFS
jgi:hypothetical protein